MPGPAGPEGPHEGGGGDRRDAEERLGIVAGEQLAIELFEVLTGVGDRE